jgi:hypothetical protein
MPKNLDQVASDLLERMAVTSGITALPLFRLLKFSVSAVAWTIGSKRLIDA